MQRIPVQVLEKRKHPSQQAGRENIIMLGMGDTNDLHILNFLGVIAKAQSQHLIGEQIPISPHTFPIKIRDLERCMSQVQEELQPNVITYESSDVRVVKEGDSASFKSGENDTQATVLIDCSGRHSPLMENLGITPKRISDRIFIVNSKFSGSPSWLSNKWYQAKAVFSLITRAAAAAIKLSFSVNAIAQHIFKQSGGLLLRVHDYDSVNVDLSKEDQATFRTI